MVCVRGVVKGFGSTAILRAAIRPVCHEKFCHWTLICCGSHVHSRVTGVKVVGDFAEEVGRCVLACSANGRRLSGKRRIGCQATGYLVDVASHDMSNEIKKG